MQRAGGAYIEIRGEDKRLKGDLDKARGKVKTTANKMEKHFKETFKNIGKAAIIGATAVAAAYIYSMKKAIDAASDLQEVQGKFDVVFAEHKKQAEDMAKVLVDSYAMSTREAKQYMSSIQDLLVPMGMMSDKALLMSNEVVKLAADLGSFNNLPTAQVMIDIQSALVGNFETMKKYGVILNETVIKQKALELGLWSGKGMVDANTKAQIAYKLMLEGSAAAIGDQERTMGSYANQMKLLKAQIEDISAAIGDKLLPEVTSWVNQLNEMIKNHPELIDQMGEYAKSVLNAAIAMGKLVGWIMGFKKYPTLLEGFQSHVKEIRKEITYLQKVTEGKAFIFAGDKEKLIELQVELAHTLKMIEKIKMMEAGRKDSRLETALEDPSKYYGALPDTATANVYKQTEEMKARYVEYYAALEEMAENADMRAIMRERERLEELEPFIAARHEICLSAYEAEEARLDEYASYRTGQEKSITEQIRAIRMTDKTFALDALKEKYENYKNFTDDLIGLELWRAAKEKEIQESGYDDMTNAMMGWANNFSSTLNDMLWGAEVTFASILESFMKMITQMMIQAAIMGPLTAGITGLFSGLFSAQGNVFSQSGLHNFAQGGIVNKPTQFAFAGGAGLMGEAGPEAIMPLTRTPRGDLGVKAVGEPSDKPQKQTINVIMNNPTFQDLETQRQTMAQIASVVAAQVAPGAVIENYENDLGIRQMVRGGI